MATLQSVWTEGALTFTFPPLSDASKYDDWSHFKNQYQRTCDGSKAVDLVFIDNHVTWLIEVKDFRQHGRLKSLELSNEIAIKVRDTIAGLVSAKLYALDHDEKSFASKLLQSRKFRVVCHIEQPIKPSKLRPMIINPIDFQIKLRTLIKAIDPHPIVANRQTLPHYLPWSVT